MILARVAVVFTSVALVSCDWCGDSLCSDQVAWSSPASAAQYSDARAGSAVVCLDDDCVSGELAWLPEAPPDRDLGGVPQGGYLREPRPSGADDVSSVWVEGWAEGGVPHLSVRWIRSMGAAVDGELFSVEIFAADGTTISSLAETAVTYDRPGGCSPCATASFEGS